MPQTARAPDYRPTRLATLRQELRWLQEKRQHVETDPSLDAERRAVEIRYYDAIIPWLQEGVERLEVALRCAGGSPCQRT